MNPYSIATWSEIADREPVGVLVGNVDLVIVRYDDNHSVLYGRCLHRGALMADGHVSGQQPDLRRARLGLPCRHRRSSYNNNERLAKFTSWIDGDELFIDLDEVQAWEKEHPQPFDRDAYQGAYQDPHGAPRSRTSA